MLFQYQHLCHFHRQYYFDCVTGVKSVFSALTLYVPGRIPIILKYPRFVASLGSFAVVAVNDVDKTDIESIKQLAITV